MVKRLSIFSWFGGKYYLLDEIFPFPEHRTYVEVCGGGATVLLNKVPCAREVYNDINGRLVNCFRTLQNQWMELEFLAKYRGALNARSLFQKYKEESPESLEDAFRFFYVNRIGYSGKNDCLGGLHNEKHNNKHIVFLNGIKKFPLIANRLKGVKIECQDFRKLIPRFDAEDTLFYIDSPYYQGGENYEKMVGNEENAWPADNFTALWKLCSEMKGKFVISIDNKIEIPNQITYCQEIERWNFSSSNSEKTKSVEYIIRNFDPAKMITQREHTRRIEEWCK